MKPFLYSLSLSLALAATNLYSLCSMQSALAVEVSPAVPLIAGDFAIDDDNKDHAVERKEIESVLSVIETQWNAHDIKAVMSNYAEDYVNNDGLDKKAVQKLTEDFWKTYPDAHAVSKTKQIRIEGNFATVESRDISVATTEMAGMPSKGELQSVSEGQQYMKRLGAAWRIIGDRIDYEKVKVAFGLAKQLNATFTAPEQVKAGKQFSAKLEVTLPPGLGAIGSITNQPLTFPQRAPMEKTRDLSDQSPTQTPVLERVMPANTDNRNELLTATVILVNPSRKMMGLSFLTRRLNVVPDQPEKDTAIAAHESAADTVASEAGKANKESGKVESPPDEEEVKNNKSKPEKSSEEKSDNKKRAAGDSMSKDKNKAESDKTDKDKASGESTTPAK